VLVALKLPGAWLAAAIYALHPLCVGSVAWIAELKNMLSMIFFAASALLYLHFDDARSPNPVDGLSPRSPKSWIAWYVLAIVAFVLAMFSKTSVITLPAILLAMMWWRHERMRLMDFAWTAPFFAIAAIFAVITVSFQQQPRLEGNIIAAPADFAERIALSGKIAWFYLDKVLAPIRLTMVYPRWDSAIASPLACGPTAMMIICGVAIWMFRKSWARPLAMGLGCFIITLLPVMSFFNMSFMKFSFVADHLVYVSALPVVVMVVCLSCWLTGRYMRNRYMTIGLGVILLGACSLLSYQRVGVFRNPVTLWTRALEVNDRSWTAWSNRAVKYEQQGRHEEAVYGHTKALELGPRDSTLWSNRGIVYSKQGKNDLAIADFTRSIEINPRFAKAYSGRAVAWTQKKRYDVAIKDFDMALRYDRENPETLNNRAITHMNQRNYDKAIADATRAIRLRPDYAEAYNSRGATYVRMDETDKAIADYTTAMKLMPDYAMAYTNRAKAYIAKKQFDQAITDYARAIAIEPANAATYYERSVLYKQMGQTDKSAADSRKAVELGWDEALVHYNHGLASNTAAKFVEAIEHFTKAIEIDPSRSRAYNNRGIAYGQLGKFKLAEKDFLKAIELDAEYKDPRANLVFLRKLMQGKARPSQPAGSSTR
jgi:tetratricopeptide (TPR) repeat protein